MKLRLVVVQIHTGMLGMRIWYFFNFGPNGSETKTSSPLSLSAHTNHSVDVLLITSWRSNTIIVLHTHTYIYDTMHHRSFRLVSCRARASAAVPFSSALASVNPCKNRHVKYRSRAPSALEKPTPTYVCYSVRLRNTTV